MHPCASPKKAFTFIELIVAVALTVILLRGMYTIFFAATELTRLSDEKMVSLLEASAVFEQMAADLVRSPFTSSDYYLSVGTVGDDDSIKFQATRLDGSTDKYVYIQYYRSGTELKRRIFGNDKTTEATLAADGEDGSPITVSNSITSFKAWYFNEPKTSVTENGAWIKTPDLTGANRTRAVKFEFTQENTTQAGDISAQNFTQMFPITY